MTTMTPNRLHAHVTAQTVALLAVDDAARVLTALRREVRADRVEPTRRGFLAALATMTAGLAVDPEQLMWTPTPTVVVAPPALAFNPQAFRLVMNAMPHQAVINAIGSSLLNNLTFARNVDRSYIAHYVVPDRVVVKGVPYDVVRYPEEQ